MNSWMVNKAKR